MLMIFIPPSCHWDGGRQAPDEVAEVPLPPLACAGKQPWLPVGLGGAQVQPGADAGSAARPVQRLCAAPHVRVHWRPELQPVHHQGKQHAAYGTATVQEPESHGLICSIPPVEKKPSYNEHTLWKYMLFFAIEANHIILYIIHGMHFHSRLAKTSWQINIFKYLV